MAVMAKVKDKHKAHIFLLTSNETRKRGSSSSLNRYTTRQVISWNFEFLFRKTMLAQ
jgi:hypothetical protein